MRSRAQAYAEQSPITYSTRIKAPYADPFETPANYRVTITQSISSTIATRSRIETKLSHPLGPATAPTIRSISGMWIGVG